RRRCCRVRVVMHMGLFGVALLLLVLVIVVTVRQGSVVVRVRVPVGAVLPLAHLPAVMMCHVVVVVGVGLRLMGVGARTTLALGGRPGGAGRRCPHRRPAGGGRSPPRIGVG